MTELFIGCPVLRREWIIDDWHEAALTAARNANLNVRFGMVGSPEDPTVDVDWDFDLIAVDEHRGKDVRKWNPDRYARMAELRNTLLDHVRRRSPDLFLSLDSDIILHPDALVALCDTIDEPYDAVGGKCFMTTGVRNPSYGMFKREGGLRRDRSNPTGVFKVDVIMAIKLMTPAAYWVDYPHRNVSGEDIGWSKACRAAGLRLAWDGRVTSRHVLDRERLHHPDDRVGSVL